MTRILLVEDDALVSRIYSQKLAESGFEVAVAGDGLVAMKQLLDFKPDLVVLDLLMPKFTGLDVIKFMRQQPELKSTPVIVFSNTFLNRMGEEVAAFGVEEMLAKAALTPELLMESIARALQRRNPAPTPSAENTEPVTGSQPPAQPTPDPPSLTTPEVRPSPPSPAPAKSPTRHAPTASRRQGSQRNESAASFRKRMRRDFFEQIPAIAKSVEQACDEYLKAADAPNRSLRLEALSRKIGFIIHMASMAACYRIGQLASALEALLFELQERPSNINDSARRTISTTVSLLADWLNRADQPDEQCLSPTTILVVDDDNVSNRALVFALSRVNLQAKSVTDPFKALEKLRENSYDAVLLDINLPGMNGISLREQMRELPLHKNTPVIFVTGYSEFEPRARAVSSAGDDFITKPIMPIELTVKVTAHVLKRRLAEQIAAAR